VTTPRKPARKPARKAAIPKTVKKPAGATVARAAKAKASGASVLPMRGRRPRRKPGRPTGLTEEVQARMIEALTLGNSMETTARYGGVTPASLYGWLVRGRAEMERVEQIRERESVTRGVPLDAVEYPKPDVVEGPYMEFLEAVERARAESVVRATAYLIQQMPNSVQAATWFLERKEPAAWGRRMTLDVGGTGEPIAVKVANLVDEETQKQQILNILDEVGGFEVLTIVQQALPEPEGERHADPQAEG